MLQYVIEITALILYNTGISIISDAIFNKYQMSSLKNPI